MNRTLGILFASFFAMIAASCATVTAPPREQPSMRSVIQITDGWEFAYNNEWSPADALGTPPSAWQPVSLPHSWNRLGEYRVGRTEATDNRQGRGWYRQAIEGADLDPTRRHFIEFDAVSNVADVWLNGQHLGSHSGAFTRFRFELTAGLDFNGSNVLLVRADNSDPQPGSTTEHVIPLLGDFFIHGGIYRPARLISVAQSHIDLTDAGGPGVYAVHSVAADRSAAVVATVRLDRVRAGQSVRIAVIDADGRNAAQTIIPLSAGQKEARGELSLKTPRLWDGREDPYLYRLEATLMDGGRALDQVVQPLGIRSIRFDPDKGFFLNGEPLKLRGVSRHQDYLGKGWALSEDDNARDMAMIAEMGANSVRVAHYPQAEQWFDLADRYGMVAWAEVPFVNKVAFSDTEASPELIANARRQMTEMIRQNFNHPSVVTWGIGNEVDIDLSFGRLGPRADARPLLRELNSLSQREDPSRPTVLADCCEATPGKKAEFLPTLTGEAELMGYNRYFGWYYGEVQDLGPHLDRLHARYPGIPLSVSEYGAGGALTQHSDDPEGRPTNVTGRPQPEEFESWLHEQTWPQIRSRDYLWGSWIWNMFDFSSRIRKEGDATDINTKGLVSFDRTIRKDAFFYYKAQWSPDPVVHITSRRFAERTEPASRIKVYSNAPSVDLTLNGAPIGTVPCIDRICTREGVTLAPGENRVTATAVFAGKPVEDSVGWTLLPQ